MISGQKINIKINKKHLWWIIPLAGVFLIILVQLLWPKNITRFGVSLAGNEFGFKNQDYVIDEIQKRFNESKVVLSFSNSREEVEVAKIGASLDSRYLEEQFFKYSTVERLIPFSLFFGRKIEKLALDFDQDTINRFIDEYSKIRESNPKDATVFVDESGEIKISEAVNGVSVQKDRLKILILGSEYIPGHKSEIVVPVQESKPPKNIDFYTGAMSRVEEIKNSRINFLYTKYGQNNRLIDQKIYTPLRSEILSWISIVEESSVAKISVNSDNLKLYVDKINQDLGIAAKPIVVSVVDGREVSRTEGELGRRVSLEHTKKMVSEFFDSSLKDTNVNLEFEDVNPIVNKNESYTNSQAGLQAKLEELGRRYDVRLSVKQLNGAGWEAHYRADESTPSASTYKLYVALKMFDEMSQGKRNWSDRILNHDHRECFNQMVVISLNECAEEWIRQFGRSNLNNYIYNLGIGRNTTFISYDAVRTTSRDLLKAVIGIYEGRYVGGENRQTLLDAMGRQKWRYGIPTGSKGRAYDKVGFLWNYIHDTAIVEHPRGTYAVAIMTKNASYGVIAQITRELESFMYP